MMTTSCINNNKYFFTLDYNSNQKCLIYTDHSEWIDIANDNKEHISESYLKILEQYKGFIKSHCIEKNHIINKELNSCHTCGNKFYIEEHEKQELKDKSRLFKSLPSYTLKIYNGNVCKEFTAFPNQSIVIHYSELPGKSSLCEKDGIYKFEATTCEGEQIFSRTEAILPKIKYLIHQLLVSNEESLVDTIIDVTKDVEIIKAFAKENDEVGALEFYRILERKLKRLNCECSSTWGM